MKAGVNQLNYKVATKLHFAKPNPSTFENIGKVIDVEEIFDGLVKSENFVDQLVGLFFSKVT